MDPVEYQSGFGNEHATEAVSGTLPVGQNSPQRVAHGLYAEQLSGSAFTAPRAHNRRTWLYRRRPSVRHITRLTDIDPRHIRTAPCREGAPPIEPMRWDPIPQAEAPSGTWVDGLCTVATNGDAHLHLGAATHLYFATQSMVDEVFVNADGELLIVPQTGGLRLHTELGVLDLEPSEIAVIPRGVKFRVELHGADARGYVCENYGAPFTLPEPGLVGLNALAMPRDFLYPVARPDDADRPTRVIAKFDGRLLETRLDHSPLDVVGWHGNYAPYKYDLRNYCPVGPVLFDHPDPSLWTVLTSGSDTPGVANVDFVLFRDRWLVQEHTFRPPWFHSNVMSELMGLIDGGYDGKHHGFRPGGMSLHNAFLPHGPDLEVFEAASAEVLEPTRMDPFLAVMFESRYRWIPTDWATASPHRQADYSSAWAGLEPPHSNDAPQ